MPRGDGTGPNGMGPMSGRAAGYCAGFAQPGWTNAGRRFFGRGGRSMNRWANTPYMSNPEYYSPPVRYESEKEYIENEIKNLNNRLASLNKRMEELSKEG